MTLSFSQKWKNGNPTKFVDRIWDGLLLNNIQVVGDYEYYQMLHRNKFGDAWEQYEPFMKHPKIHTIREDKTDRWKVDNNIHFVINNRTSKRFQFAPILKAKAIQEVEINSRFGYASLEVVIDGKIFAQYHYNYDKPKNLKGLVEFIRNDGFEGKTDRELITNFKNYFAPHTNDVFKGKIIHWTDLKY